MDELRKRGLEAGTRSCYYRTTTPTQSHWIFRRSDERSIAKIVKRRVQSRWESRFRDDEFNEQNLKTTKLNKGEILSIHQSTNGNDMDVPVFASGGEVVREESVPDDWVEQNDRARDAKRYLEEELSGVGGFRGTARTNADRAIGKYHVSEIVVYAEPDSELTERGVRDRIEGVPVFLRTEDDIIDTAFEQVYDPILGGVHANTTSSTTSGHTTTCRTFHNDDPCLMLPRHAYSGGRCSTSLTDTECYQYGDRVGHLVDDWQQLDVAVANCNNSKRNGISAEIVGQNGTLDGYVMAYGVDVLQSRNATVHKRGIGTAKTSGKIIDVDRSIECDSPASDLAEVVMSSASQQAGDSGGPVYVVDDTETPPKIYLVKLATQKQVGMPNHGSSMGVAAWHINAVAGLTFSP